MSSIRLPKTTGNLEGNYLELHQHEKGHRNYQQKPGGNEVFSTISELKNTVEGIKSRLHEQRIESAT